MNAGCVTVCWCTIHCNASQSVHAVARSRDDVDRTLQSAKLETNELHTTAQCLYMSAEIDNDAVKLIEMDNSLLNSLLAGNW